MIWRVKNMNNDKIFRRLHKPIMNYFQVALIVYLFAYLHIFKISYHTLQAYYNPAEIACYFIILSSLNLCVQ